MMKRLDEIPQKNSFKVPENYFDELNARIIASTAGIEPVKLKVVYKKRFSLLAVAASIAGIVLLSYAGYRILSPAQESSRLAEIVNGENIELFMNDLDISLIEQNAPPVDARPDASEVSSSEIVDYLLRENVDLNDIYERL
jgi:hypothetical protein